MDPFEHDPLERGFEVTAERALRDQGPPAAADTPNLLAELASHVKDSIDALTKTHPVTRVVGFHMKHFELLSQITAAVENAQPIADEISTLRSNIEQFKKEFQSLLSFAQKIPATPWEEIGGDSKFLLDIQLIKYQIKMTADTSAVEQYNRLLDTHQELLTNTKSRVDEYIRNARQIKQDTPAHLKTIETKIDALPTETLSDVLKESRRKELGLLELSIDRGFRDLINQASAEQENLNTKIETIRSVKRVPTR